jgi:hypothetical protein
MHGPARDHTALFTTHTSPAISRDPSETRGPTLCCPIMLPGKNRSSGPDFGRILIGKTSKSALRPAESRPESRF